MFVVIYRWRVEPGQEEAFRQEWREGTLAIRMKYRYRTLIAEPLCLEVIEDLLV
ncbi:MAG: hypothetical protein U1A16_02550 [Patescibacteria group bacterium]|nr:hypothetical protein [Patescibacteria group bacterium]